MTCAEAILLINDRLDGELRPEQTDALEAHLSACPECRRLAESLEGLDRKVSELREPAPEGLKRGVLYRIDQAVGKAKKPSRRWFGPGAAIGAVAAVLVLLVGVGVIPLGRPARDAKPNAADSFSGNGTAVQSPDTAPANSQLDWDEPAPADEHGTDSFDFEHHASYQDANASKGGSSPLEENDWHEAPVSTVDAVPNTASGRTPDAQAPTAEFDPAETEPPEDTYYLSGGSGSKIEPTPVADTVRSACAKLSAENDALVLLYTEFDFPSLLSLLAEEEPDLYDLVEKLESRELEGLTCYPTDCGTALAVQEWLLQNLPQSEVMDPALREAETRLMIRMEALDPGSESLYRVITWSPRTRPISWPDVWPDGWAARLRTEENWAMFFPAEDYVPTADHPAFLVFLSQN